MHAAKPARRLLDTTDRWLAFARLGRSTRAFGAQPTTPEDGMRSQAIVNHLIGLVSLVMLLAVAVTTEGAPSSNVAYRRIDVQDAVTGELFPVALWYPTR